MSDVSVSITITGAPGAELAAALRRLADGLAGEVVLNVAEEISGQFALQADHGPVAAAKEIAPVKRRKSRWTEKMDAVIRREVAAGTTYKEAARQVEHETGAVFAWHSIRDRAELLGVERPAWAKAVRSVDKMNAARAAKRAALVAATQAACAAPEPDPTPTPEPPRAALSMLLTPVTPLPPVVALAPPPIVRPAEPPKAAPKPIPAPATKPSRAEVLAKIGAVNVELPISHGKPIVADHATVKSWAAQRGLPFVTWDDLPRVNSKREQLGLMPFARAFINRGVRAAE